MEVLETTVRDALRTVIDPELGINIVDLGLIYKIQVTGNKEQGTSIHILMTLTTPGCPLSGWFIEHVKEAVVGIVGVEEEMVRVEITFDPPWTMELMEAEARAELGFD